MMKNLLRILGAGLILVLGINSLQASDLKDDFMGTKWQTDLSTLKNFLKVEEKGDLSYYVNPTVVHVIDDIKIPQAIYGTYKNQFFAVYIQVDRSETFSKLKRYITEKYGKPKTTMRINPDRTVHTWKHHRAKIKLKQNDNTGEMKLGFYYTPMSSKVNELQAEAFQKSKGRIQIDRERAVETLDLLKF
jgi:hypothetical protein